VFLAHVKSVFSSAKSERALNGLVPLLRDGLPFADGSDAMHREATHAESAQSAELAALGWPDAHPNEPVSQNRGGHPVAVVSDPDMVDSAELIFDEVDVDAGRACVKGVGDKLAECSLEGAVLVAAEVLFRQVGLVKPGEVVGCLGSGV
jgi:hypothetical protein